MYCYVIEDDKTKSGYRLIKDYSNNIIILKGYRPSIKGEVDDVKCSCFLVIVYQEYGQTKIGKVVKITLDENEGNAYIYKHRKDRKVGE